MLEMRQGIVGRSSARKPQRTNWMSNIIGGVAFGLSLCMLVASKVEATEFHFTKIADTNTPVPSGTGHFTSFNDPAIDNGNVAFKSGEIYKSVNNLLSLVSDSNINVALLRNPSDPSLDGENVAFRSGVNSGNFDSLFSDYRGTNIYAEVDGSLIRFPNVTTPAPGIGIEGFDRPSYDNGHLAFRVQFRYSGASSASFIYGILTNVGGSFRLISTSYTRYVTSSCSNRQARGPYTAAGNPIVSDGVVVYSVFSYCPVIPSAEPPIQAILANAGSSAVLVDSNTAIPGGTGNFTNFGGYGFDNGNLAFRGIGVEQQGIYTKIDGELGVVADLNTTIPDGSDRFTNFGDPAFDRNNVAFVGFYPDGQSLYTNIGNTLRQIIASGQTLDDKIVSSISIGREAISGHQIAFRAVFTDGSSGIYVATVEL